MCWKITHSIAALLLILGAVYAPGVFAKSTPEECANKFQQLEDELYYGARCESDKDCQSVHFGCPFGCGTAVNRSFDVAVFNVKKKLYENECGTCAYMCVKEPKELMCANKYCRLIYHSEIQSWRDELKRKQEEEERERIELYYFRRGQVKESIDTIE